MVMNTRSTAMTVIVKDGKAQLDLPDFPDGQVMVTVERPFNPDTDWTEEELAELEALSVSHPRTGAEVMAMIESGALDLSGWQKMEITDSVEWVQQQRDRTQRRKPVS